MSKFAKGVLITATVCLVLGLSICIIVGVTQGFGALKNGIHWLSGRGHYQTEDLPTLIFSDDITSLEIDLPYGNVEIRTGSFFTLEGKNLIQGTISTWENDGTLVIRQDLDDSFLPGNVPEQELIITVPEDFLAENVDLDFGAGNIKVEGLKTKNGTYDFGVGEVSMRSCQAETLTLKAGVGKVEITDSDFGNVTMESGVGEIDFSGSMKGRCKLSSGIGAVTLHLYGDPKDYYFGIEAGIGGVSLKYSSDSMSGDALYTNKHGDFGDFAAPNRIDVTSGIGEVEIEIREN